MENNKKVLITGGAGFIGQALVKRFEKVGHDVCVFDLESPELAGGKYIRCDVFDFEKLRDAVRRHDIIIHLVGLANARAAQKEPAKSFKLNVASLQNVLEACRVDGGDKKLIFPSSAAVYGITHTLPVREDFTPHPLNVYSWHKHMCEKMVHCYHENYGLEYIISRLFNVYGRGSKGVIELFLSKAARGEIIESFGLDQYRDFVYAGDVAEAFYQSAMTRKASNRIINVGSGKGTQIKEILELLRKFYPDLKWVHRKEKERVILYDSIADITLAKMLFDYKPHASKKFMEKIIAEEMTKNT